MYSMEGMGESGGRMNETLSIEAHTIDAVRGNIIYQVTIKTRLQANIFHNGLQAQTVDPDAAAVRATDIVE